MPQQDFFSDVAPVYDRMIRWEKRLAAEEPLFAELWRRTGARTLLDASCGSGRHLPLFHRQGMRIAAASDASEAMLALAAAQVAALPEADRPVLTRATWDELPARVPGQFDAVLCLGNSLPYVLDAEARRASLAGLWAKVAPGGFLLVQFVNFARMRAKGERFLPIMQTLDRAAGREYVGLRQYDWREQTVDFNVMILSRPLGDLEAEWALQTWTTPLATLSPEDAAAPLRALGAAVEVCGSLALEPYDPPTSSDIVLLARK